MEKKFNEKIYLNFHNIFFDKIIINNRKKILSILLNLFKPKLYKTILDIGTTSDTKNISSNYIIKNLDIFDDYKSISDQDINDPFFSKTLKKSIVKKFDEDDLDTFRSDIVISNATIEHVGNFENQLNMCKNMIKLSKKYFVIITPNRYHPIEFHTKLPFLHWLPKKIHRFFLNIFGFKSISKEENLNLLSFNDIVLLMEQSNFSNYKIIFIKFFFFKSNFILIGSKN